MSNNKAEQKDYWELRAEKRFIYKREVFYTITPIPYYYKRREILLNLMKPVVLSSKSICDFGCGDGYYLKFFSNLASDKISFVGMDISSEMLKLSRSENPDFSHFQSLDEIESINLRFDLIYCFAVFAHITTGMDSLVEKLKTLLHPGGKIAIFEQVAPHEYEGETFIRRTIYDYENIFKSHGFVTLSKKLISFDCHRFFERHVAKKYYRIFNNKKNTVDARINANRHMIFRLLSHAFLLFDINPVKHSVEKGWGYIFMIFEK